MLAFITIALIFSVLFVGTFSFSIGRSFVRRAAMKKSALSMSTNPAMDALKAKMAADPNYDPMQGICNFDATKSLIGSFIIFIQCTIL